MWGLAARLAKELVGPLAADEAKRLARDGEHRRKRLEQFGGALTALRAGSPGRNRPAEESPEPKEALAELLQSVATKDEMRDALDILQIDLRRRMALQMRLLGVLALLQVATILILLLRR